VSLLIIKTNKMTQFKRIIPVLVLILAPMMFTSCDKKEEIRKIISESEAVEMIESSLQANAGSLSSNLEDLAIQLTTAVTSGEICDTLYTHTIEKDQQGGQMQAAYSSDLSYEMTCNSLDIPQTATFSVSTDFMYNTPRIISDDDAVFTGTVSGINPSASSMNLAGNYRSTGTQELNFKEQERVNSSFAVDLIDLKVNKQSNIVESGSGTFLFSGASSDANFSYTGTILFKGNQTATLTLNGSDYEVDWK